jgi:hypothetical protein
MAEFEAILTKKYMTINLSQYKAAIKPSSSSKIECKHPTKNMRLPLENINTLV